MRGRTSIDHGTACGYHVYVFSLDCEEGMCIFECVFKTNDSGHMYKFERSELSVTTGGYSIYQRFTSILDFDSYILEFGRTIPINASMSTYADTARIATAQSKVLAFLADVMDTLTQYTN